MSARTSAQTQVRWALAHTLLTSGMLVSGLGFGSAAQAAVTFEFNFLDDAGTGFHDATSGASRQAALHNAAGLFSTLFGSHFSNSGTIVLDATAHGAEATGSLAHASSVVLPGGASAGFDLQGVVSTKLQTGLDLNGSDSDGLVDFNFSHDWQLDADAPFSASQYDFYGVAFHEFTHALGFAAYINQDGTDLYGQSQAGRWGAFAQFLADKDGNAVIEPSTFNLNAGTWATASIGGASPAAGLFFNGAHATAANGGQLVGLYLPTTWSGSSVSHLDADNAAYSGMMMLPSVSPGRAARDYSAVEVGMMQDLGYARVVTAVPEPQTWAMLFAGLGVVGWRVRSRSSSDETSRPAIALAATVGGLASQT